ncbi:hypothetical protein FW764_20695 [Pseudomonas sp. 1152_12]
MWEGACSRWQCVSQQKYRLNHRYREQAPSHIFLPKVTFRLRALTVADTPAPTARHHSGCCRPPA